MATSGFLLVAIAALYFTPVKTDLDVAKLRVQLIHHEDKKAKVYKDSEGLLTIGVGFNLQRPDAKKKITSLGLDYDKVLVGKQTLSEEQIDKLLDDDIATAIRDCQAVFPKFVELSDVRQRVLAEMMFNLGKPRFLKFEKMITAVKEGKFGKAADEMKDSKWYRQVKSRGNTLETMMRTDKEP